MEKPAGSFKRAIRALVGAETAYALLFERLPETWAAIPASVRLAVKAVMWWLVWQALAALAWFQGWIERTLPSYLTFSLLVGTAIVVSAIILRLAILRLLDSSRGVGVNLVTSSGTEPEGPAREEIGHWRDARSSAVLAIIGAYNKLVYHGVSRELFEQLYQPARILWSQWLAPAEKEETSKVREAWSIIATIHHEFNSEALPEDLVKKLRGAVTDIALLYPPATNLILEPASESPEHVSGSEVEGLDEAMAKVPASPESFERYRELWQPAKSAMRLLNELLLIKATNLAANVGVRRVAGDHLVAEARRFSADIMMLDDRMYRTGSTQYELLRLNEALDALAQHFAWLAKAWIDIGSEGGSEFFGTEEYRLFWERHREFCTAVRQVQARIDFGGLLRDHEFFRIDAIPSPHAN